MSKLRLIQERKNQLEDSTDLRGLGEGDLIKDHKPVAYLFVENCEEGAIKKTCELLGLKFEKTDGIHILTKNSTVTASNFKEDTLTLFAASIILENKNKSMHFCLGVLSNLHKALDEAINQHESSQHSIKTDLKNWTHRGISITAESQLHLQQAGFSIQSSSNILTGEEFTKLKAEFSQRKPKLIKVA